MLNFKKNKKTIFCNGVNGDIHLLVDDHLISRGIVHLMGSIKDSVLVKNHSSLIYNEY